MSLDVYLHRERIGTLFPAGEGDCRFAYLPETVDRLGGGAHLLSAALPVREEPYSNEATRAYADGLLPDGRRRVQLARRLELDLGDTYGLLAAVGGDCAGAVAFLQAGESPDPGPLGECWFSPEDLEQLVVAPPGRGSIDPRTGEALRSCLPGIHHKLAVVRDEASARWGRSGPGRPSTHVIKPETGEFPDLVANEMFCMSVARASGLPVAETEVTTLAGQPCLVSRRFDRNGLEGPAARIHQEDFCQALAYPPGAGAGPFLARTVEEGIDRDADGPGFAESCGLLRAVGAADCIPTLITAAFCNYVLGNGDAHGKNFALLYDPPGARLAPFYDIASTAVYDAPTHAGMVINEDYDETAYLLELARMSEECGFDFEDCRRLASATAARIGESLEKVSERSRREGWHAPVVDRILEMGSERAFGLGAEVEY